MIAFSSRAPVNVSDCYFFATADCRQDVCRSKRWNCFNSNNTLYVTYPRCLTGKIISPLFTSTWNVFFPAREVWHSYAIGCRHCKPWFMLLGLKCVLFSTSQYCRESTLNILTVNVLQMCTICPCYVDQYHNCVGLHFLQNIFTNEITCIWKYF